VERLLEQDQREEDREERLQVGEERGPRSADAGYRRETTFAGGIEGGMSTGEILVVRAAMKPLAI